MYTFEEELPPLPNEPIESLKYAEVLHSSGNKAYDEPDNYRVKESFVENGESKTIDKIVYATIKAEALPELVLENDDEILDIDAEEEEEASKDKSEKGHHSPQTILDPTITKLDDDYKINYVIKKKLPPEPLPLDAILQYGDKDSKKVPPPVPPMECSSPLLDLKDVEFADASDEEGNVFESRNNSINSGNISDAPDNMTADEAERLLSSRWVS